MRDLVGEGEASGPVAAEGPRRRWLGPAVLAAAPWVWFGIRLVGPQLDLIAVLLPVLTGITLLSYLALAVLRGRPRHGVAVASLIVFAAVAILSPRIPHPNAAPSDPFVLVAANTFDGNRTPAGVGPALASLRPDVLVAVETSDDVRRSLSVSFAGYAHSQGDKLDVYSIWPLRVDGPLRGVPEAAALRVRVDRPGAPFVIVAVHLLNPLHEISFSDQLAMAESLLAGWDQDRDLPLILAGDFNASDRSDAYRTLAGSMRDAMRSTWPGETYVGGVFGTLDLRIDHVFEPTTWCSSDAGTFPVPGSDHVGLAVRLGACEGPTARDRPTAG